MHSVTLNIRLEAVRCDIDELLDTRNIIFLHEKY